MNRFWLFAVLLFVSISTNAQDVFPDVVSVSTSSDMVRVKGTKYYVHIPVGYQHLPRLLRYQKDGSTYFQVMEMPNGNFTTYRVNMTRRAIEAKGAKVDVYETAKYNGYDAIYMEGPSKIEGETKIGLMFGNEKFIAMIIGVCKSDDKASREELRNIFATSRYDDGYKLDPFELAGFQVDETIAGFQYSTKVGNAFVYLPKDHAGPRIAADSTSFQVCLLEAESLDKVKEFMQKVNAGMELEHIKVLDKNETTINGNKAYEVTVEGASKDGETNIVYEVGMIKPNTSSAVVFIGIDTRKRQFRDKFKATARSVKIL